MPAENTDTPSTGIDVNTAASQLAGLFGAEDGNPEEERDGDEATDETAGDEDAEEAEGEETAPEDSEEDVDVEDDEASEDDEQPDTKAEEEFEIDLGRGEKVKVKRDELIKGYLRQSDYTRKTQEVAEGRKRLESEATEVLRERTQYSVLLGALEQQLKLAEKADEPDWDALYQQNPIQAVQYERKWRAEKAERQEKLAAVDCRRLPSSRSYGSSESTCRSRTRSSRPNCCPSGATRRLPAGNAPRSPSMRFPWGFRRKRSRRSLTPAPSFFFARR
jgi:hypothetical protein